MFLTTTTLKTLSKIRLMQLKKCIKSTTVVLSGGGTERNRRRVDMVHRLDFDLALHRLAAAADGGGSEDSLPIDVYLIRQPHLPYIRFRQSLITYLCGQCDKRKV